jgi:hypothetical protein
MRIGIGERGRFHRLLRALHVVPQADEAAAASVLGEDHELVNVLARRRALTVQILVTSIPLAMAAIGLARDVHSAPVVLGAAAIVELGLLVAVPYFRGRTRDLAEELIVAGDDAARRLRVVDDEYRRLASRKERERLARSLERLLQDAGRRYRILAGHRPPLGVHCLRHTMAEAREVVALLRTQVVDVRGVALTSRLLTDGQASPLFGENPERLREELHRIRYLLAAPSSEGPPTDPGRLAA